MNLFDPITSTRRPAPGAPVLSRADLRQRGLDRLASRSLQARWEPYWKSYLRLCLQVQEGRYGA
jgi:hypothetical protein